jgi:serine/threonine protein kinase
MKKNSKIAENALQSFNREISIMQGLRHPNVVRVIGSVSESESLSLVLEFVDGGSLAGILTKCGKYPESLAAIYMDQVLAGLEYLHANGVIHRDVKGGNILVTKEGVAKLVDFGCAAAICSDMSKRVTVVGSPYWMAPEVVGMTGTCAQSDIWSFASTVMELVTTQPPYWGMPPVSAMFHIVSDAMPPLPPDISGEL